MRLFEAVSVCSALAFKPQKGQNLAGHFADSSFVLSSEWAIAGCDCIQGTCSFGSSTSNLNEISGGGMEALKCV